MANQTENGASEVTEDYTLQLPPDKDVIFYNDDFTTMDFVVDVLVSIFDKSETDADAIMMDVHNNGSAVVGTYTYDIATSRANLTRSLARKNGFPLRVAVE